MWHDTDTCPSQLFIRCVYVSGMMSEQVRIRNGTCSRGICIIEDIPDTLDKMKITIICFVQLRPYWTELPSLLLK